MPLRQLFVINLPYRDNIEFPVFNGKFTLYYMHISPMLDISVHQVQGINGHFAFKEHPMAKGQQKKSREARKPKADNGPKQNASQPSLKPGGIKGLENMKNS
jgi:hypothetical protein